jgi:ABC-2 type transport system ATP-binding protein
MAATFRAHPNEVTGYVGPNGSGKSTTLKMIAGLLQMTTGRICFDGSSIHENLDSFRSRFGYVHEEPYLYLT